MKKISSYSFATLLLMLVGMLTACGEFEPTGYEEVPGLAKVSDLKAAVQGHDIVLSWTNPAASNIDGLRLIKNGENATAVTLEPGTTSYTVVGQPMAVEYFYTVKVLYSEGYMSEGVSVTATLPQEELANVSNLKTAVNGRSVTLSWSLPSQAGLTAIRVLRNNDSNPLAELEPTATSCVLKGQPMDQELTFSVQAVYDTYYAASGVSANVKVPYITPKMAYLLTAASWRDLPDDDERAAASWFAQQDNAEFIQVAQIADLDADIYPVMWIEIDRVGLPFGWENLPGGIADPSTIAALKNYIANGGNLYLANMATQLTLPLGYVPEGMQPTIFGNGDGGSGDDVWVINPFLGVDFKNGGDQGYYDRTAHAIYKGLTFEDPNNYGYLNLPLIGPGQREDHNCMWDCNIYGRGNQIDVIKNFEVTTNSLVLATWGHVRDHCVAGLVEFYPNTEHGRCIANGFAAYEWNQNSGSNPYQKNVEQLTLNILNYLK